MTSTASPSVLPPPGARANAARKGRGAQSNVSGRYETHARSAEDDGWSFADPEPPPLRTEVTIETARTIISTNDSPDISFDQTINTYRGCEHGCVYCYARPNHAYAGLSPGLDFESRLFVKANAAELLARELARPGYVPKTIVLGGVTDVYQPLERTWKVTRAVLEVLAAHRHPVALVTKSALVLRDLDILAPMAAAGLAKVAVSVTTLDPKLARAMEPRAAAPHRRLDTIRALTEAGVPTGVMTAPLIPALNDHEIDALLEAAAAAGAVSAGYVALRLPLEIAQLFQEWLAANAPDRAQRVMKLVREMRGGRDYDPAWGVRQRGTGPYAQLMAQRFRAAAKRHGLDRPRTRLDVSQFRVPPKPGDQLGLFDT
ncbi:MAG: PA0069 family radical SAM protein [Alphaproteobacteria bacterium]|nr:PA0069 family radical SAM protein [Alphaproteobacteria bacterium]